MNREIKFRFWVENSKFITQGISIKDIFIYKDQVLNNIVMQFTGLKDKYGVEIYESDILLFEDDFERQEVIFKNASFGINGKYTFIPLESLNFSIIKVAGNIYQH